MTSAQEKEIARKILEVLDGLPFSQARKIIKLVADDIFENAYVEVTGFEHRVVVEYKSDTLDRVLAELQKTVDDFSGKVDEELSDEDVKRINADLADVDV